VSGTPDRISADEVPISRLRVTPFPPDPSAHAAAPRLPTVMMKFPFRVSPTVLLWFRVMVMLRFLSSALVFHAFPRPPP
jgi:hypothetical protein